MPKPVKQLSFKEYPAIFTKFDVHVYTNCVVTILGKNVVYIKIEPSVTKVSRSQNLRTVVSTWKSLIRHCILMLYFVLTVRRYRRQKNSFPKR